MVRLKPDATNVLVRLKPDTTYAFGPAEAGHYVDVFGPAKPDTTYAFASSLLSFEPTA